MNEKTIKLLIIVGIIAAIVLIIIGWVAASYNGLVKADEGVAQKWGNVQSAYQRRADLIPNLVETVTGYKNFEQQTLVQVTQLRSEAGQAKSSVNSARTPAELQAASTQMDGVLSRLLVIVENYPNLKANENFLSLQDELAGTENRVKTDRDLFNKAVKDLNIKVRKFPARFVANTFGFAEKEMFAAAAGAETAPSVGALFS